MTQSKGIRHKAVTTDDLPKCGVCRAPLRPYKAPLSKWPGTKAKVSTRPLRCTTHQEGKGTATVLFSGHTKYTIPKEEVRLIRRLVTDWTEDPDDRLLILTSLVGDDID